MRRRVFLRTRDGGRVGSHRPPLRSSPQLFSPPDLRPRNDLRPIQEAALTFAADRGGESRLASDHGCALMGHAEDLDDLDEADGPFAALPGLGRRSDTFDLSPQSSRSADLASSGVHRGPLPSTHGGLAPRIRSTSLQAPLRAPVRVVPRHCGTLLLLADAIRRVLPDEEQDGQLIWSSCDEFVESTRDDGLGVLLPTGDTSKWD